MGVVLVMFAVTLSLDTVSRYRLLLSLDTYLLCVALLYAEPLARLWRRIKPFVVRALGPAVPYLPATAVVALVLWSVGQFYHPDTGLTSLIQFGDQFEARALPALRAVPHAVREGAGYDGQFYAQLALDPLLRSESIDTALDGAAYRGRRILLPSLARAHRRDPPPRRLQRRDARLHGTGRGRCHAPRRSPAPPCPVTACRPLSAGCSG